MPAESNKPNHLVPGGADYQRLAEEEIHHYSEIFLGENSHPSARETLQQPVPQSWVEIETRAAALVQARTGNNLCGHVLARLGALAAPRMLSLGSGPGGLELAFSREARQAFIQCIDLNPDLVELGQKQAECEHLNVQFQVADLNRIDLPEREYDIVFCHASLHHVLELERIAGQIAKSLRPSGALITVDVCTRNGYLMWTETRSVVGDLFQALPTRFRLNHTAYACPKVDDVIWEMDTSASSMECIRAEEIIPVLAKFFRVQHFVPYFSICRRFLDTMYGPNYDLSRSLDASLLNWLWQLDSYYLHNGVLKPETFFGIYVNR